MRAWSVLLVAVAVAGPSAAYAEPPIDAPALPTEGPLLDRVAVRWHAPETGGVGRPQYVFERELAFEARLEALADPEQEPVAYRDRHVGTALDRHIAESLLASLPILPGPSAKEVADQAEAARVILEQRVRGRPRLLAAALAEGVSAGELDALLRRQARASLYLDRMIAPMLEPTELELRDLLQTGATPFKGLPYDEVAPALGRWLVGQRLGQALETYYQSARGRVVISLIHPG